MLQGIRAGKGSCSRQILSFSFQNNFKSNPDSGGSQAAGWPGNEGSRKLHERPSVRGSLQWFRNNEM
eukprot:564075-Pelagomonas_calceolata.AAC.1